MPKTIRNQYDKYLTYEKLKEGRLDAKMEKIDVEVERVFKIWKNKNVLKIGNKFFNK